MNHPSLDGLTAQSERHAAPQAELTNSVRALQTFGQSVWLDYLRRSLFTSGEFKRLIAEDGLGGATSNPSIFEKAIAGSTDYLAALQDIERRGDMDPMALYEALAIGDIRDAAHLLRPVYDSTARADGYVSLEVSPYLAHDTAATINEARRLWKAVARDNVMIKVPASIEGLPVIRELTSEGINVNITLLFGIERYQAVARAYMEGLSTFVQHGGDPARVCSVASFFVSRIDTMVDDMIAGRLATVTDAGLRTSLAALLGTAAIANAKLAYQRYLALCRTDEWQRLAAKGAHPQRLLWASTGTKNPRYRDVRYVEELIGRDTINTITPATLEAFRDHGRLRASLEDKIDDARATIAALERVGVSLKDVTDRLLEDGVTLFRTAFDHLLDQPDVEASKVATRALTSAFEHTGALPADPAIYEDPGISLLTDASNAAALEKALGGDRSLVGYLRAHLNRLEQGDYFAILAYLAMNESHREPLQAMRQTVRERKHVATSLGFGPRFLHSTGQAYKGGPNSGVFLQVTCDDAKDILVPGQRYSFGVAKAAEARGDFTVLVERKRRALRVHLGADVDAGLIALRTALLHALS